MAAPAGRAAGPAGRGPRPSLRLELPGLQVGLGVARAIPSCARAESTRYTFRTRLHAGVQSKVREAAVKRHLVSRVLALALVVCGFAAGSANAMRTMCNVPIRTGDGLLLRANLWLPDQDGKYPTVLTVSGYNKDATNPTGQACSGSGGLAAADTSLTSKGYAVMLVDDRGTGASQGKWDSWGERTQLDYQDLLDFIQAQPWSNGSVATTGGSYMGITSFLVAEADAVRVRHGKPRAFKAIYADVPMSDAYRDVTF